MQNTVRVDQPSSDEGAAAERPLIGSFGWALLLVLSVAVTVRVAYLWSYLHSPDAGLLVADQRFYWNWGVRISEGDWLGNSVFTQGPLYAYLLGILFAVIGPVQPPLLVLQMLMGVVTSLLIFDCARRLFDLWTAVIAGLMAGVYGPFVFYECMVMKTFLSPLFTMLTLWSALRYGNSRSPWWLVVAGVSVGLACLLRENHVLLLIPIVWWCWSVNRKAETGRWRIWLRHSGILLLAWAAMVAPVSIRNASVAGEFVAVTSGGGEVFYIAHGPHAQGYYNAPPFIRSDTRFEHADFRIEANRRSGRSLSAAESSRYWFWEGVAHIVSDPLRALRLTTVKLLILFNDFEVPDSGNYSVTRQRLTLLGWLPSFGLFCGLGLLGILLSCRRSICWLPLGLMLCHVFTVLLLYNYGRFRLGMQPLMILFAACALTWLGREMVSERKNAIMRVLSALIFVAALTVFSYVTPVGYAEAGFPISMPEYKEFLEQRAEQLKEIEALRTAVAREVGKHSVARLNLARALTHVGNEDEAERLFAQILTTDAGNIDVKHEWAVLKIRRGKFGEAIADLRQVIRDQPKNIPARLHLAEALQSQSPEDAAAALESALAIAPKDTRVRLTLAVLRFQQRHVEEARRHIAAVLRNQPNHPAALRLRGVFDKLQD